MSKSPLDKNSLMDDSQILENKTNNGPETAKPLLAPMGMGGLADMKTSDLFTVKGVNVPDCAKGCTKELFATFDVAFRSGNNFERFSNICDRFNETVVCLADLSHCSTYEIFDTLSSGMRYMCIEQREGCLKKCNAQGIFTGWAVYAALRNAQLITPRMGKIPSKFNVDFFRKMTGEACGVLQCYLGCLRSRYNNRCYGVAGSLLSEVLVRPIAESSDSMTLSPLSNFAKLVLPKECGYLTTPSALWSLRIDKKLDDDLKRAYTRTQKVKEFRYYLPNSTVVTNKKPNPFTRDLTDRGVSPLDDNFDRDDLWRNTMSRGRYARAVIDLLDN